MTDAPTPASIFRLGFGFWESKALLSAVELGVFTELAKGPADLATLSRRLGLHDRSARDFLDALVALKLLDRHDGRYCNTAETDLFLDRGKPTYVGGLLEMANSRLYPNWGLLTEALKTGRNQTEAKGSGDVFAALYADPKRLRGFLAAMSGSSRAPAQAIAAKFPWQNYKSFVDIGSAQGMLPATVARAHPHLSGAGYDLPEVKPIFEEFVTERGVSDRVKFLAGNFFTDPLPAGDVLIMQSPAHRRIAGPCDPMTGCGGHARYRSDIEERSLPRFRGGRATRGPSKPTPLPSGLRRSPRRRSSHSLPLRNPWFLKLADRRLDPKGLLNPYLYAGTVHPLD